MRHDNKLGVEATSNGKGLEQGDRETGSRMSLIVAIPENACGKPEEGPTVWLWALCLHGKSLTLGERSAGSRAHFDAPVLFYSKPFSHTLLNTLLRVLMTSLARYARV